MTINVGRRFSGGVFNGLFGNPVKETVVTEQYRSYFKRLIIDYPEQIFWLKQELTKGSTLYCPGCGLNSPTCHARIIEQELAKL